MISFEKEGWISVWSGMSAEDREQDILKSFCGIDYYDVDFQEILVAPDWEVIDSTQLFERLSFADSYLDKLIHAATTKGLVKCRYVVAQFNFKYDPKKVTKPIAPDPVFVGTFRYSVPV